MLLLMSEIIQPMVTLLTIKILIVLEEFFLSLVSTSVVLTQLKETTQDYGTLLKSSITLKLFDLLRAFLVLGRVMRW